MIEIEEFYGRKLDNIKHVKNDISGDTFFKDSRSSTNCIEETNTALVKETAGYAKRKDCNAL